MAKKYLSIHEAAEMLGMQTEELNRLRESGELRGFSDRGTWKFRFDDIDTLKRERTVDSDPDVPIYTDDLEQTQQLDLDRAPKGAGEATDPMLDLDEMDEDDSVLSGLSGLDAAAGAEASVLAEDDPDDLATTISREDFSTSDSDVRLIVDDSATMAGSKVAGSDSDVSLVPDSDSDVRLVGGTSGAAPAADSDSDVKLVEEKSDEFDLDIPAPGDSDSDIRLGEYTLSDGSGSDSEVRLAPDSMTSDSDVRLEGSSHELSLDSPATMEVTAADALDDEESGIALEFDDNDDSASVLLDDIPGGESSSGVLGAGESGISLEMPSDSGVSLDMEDDEGLALATDDDSGIALDPGSDSSLVLDASGMDLAADSGISLESIGDSGIALDGGSGISLASSDSDFGGTVPMMHASAGDDDVMDTAFEIPTDDSNFDLADSIELESDDLDDATQELNIDDSVDELADSIGDSAFDMDDLGSGDDFSETAFGEDEFDSGMSGDDFGVVEGDDAFEDIESGMSETGFAPVGGVRAATVVEREWGIAEVLPIALTSVIMLGLGAMMLDLLNTMWGYDAGTSPVAGPLLGLFGKGS